MGGGGLLKGQGEAGEAGLGELENCHPEADLGVGEARAASWGRGLSCWTLGGFLLPVS